MKRSKLLLGLTMCALLSGWATLARAGIIYEDLFSRGTTSTPTNLSGTQPTTNTNNATWTTWQYPGYAWRTDGTEALTPQNNIGNASLPLTLAAGATYTFSATLIPAASASTNWLAMGFGATATGGINTSTTEAWLLYRANGGTQTFYGGGAANGQAGATGTSGAADRFTITLTTNATLSSAAVAFSDTSGLVSRNVTLNATQLANIGAVNIGAQGITGSFQDVYLSTSIPEPASLALLAVGGLFLRRRRQRA